MTSKEKATYRKTSQWKDWRKYLLHKRGCVCEMCGIPKRVGLQIHHLDEAHYKDLTEIKFKILCGRCHRLIEQIIRRKDFDVYEFTDNIISIYKDGKHYGGL